MRGHGGAGDEGSEGLELVGVGDGAVLEALVGEGAAVAVDEEAGGDNPAAGAAGGQTHEGVGTPQEVGDIAVEEVLSTEPFDGAATPQGVFGWEIVAQSLTEVGDELGTRLEITVAGHAAHHVVDAVYHLGLQGTGSGKTVFGIDLAGRP